MHVPTSPCIQRAYLLCLKTLTVWKESNKICEYTQIYNTYNDNNSTRANHLCLFYIKITF